VSSTLSPYPGLRPFTFEEAHLFFGREQQVFEMLKLLEHQRFLAVIGSSGCGKSSLVRAGLLPEIQDGFLTVPRRPDQIHAEQWHLVTMRPGDERRSSPIWFAKS
jgi:ABC-type nitrate/sulfonate/bicarbonate transport system ATPase subunit